MKLSRQQLDAAGRMFDASCAPAIKARKQEAEELHATGVKHYMRVLASEKKYLTQYDMRSCAKDLANHDKRFNRKDDCYTMRTLKTEFLDTLILADESADIKAVMATFIARLK